MKNKRILAACMSALMLGSTMLVSAAEIDNCLYRELPDGTLKVIACRWSEGKITVPAEANGKSVTRIEDISEYTRYAQVIELPDSVTYIGTIGGDSLREIKLPVNLKQLGENAFAWCGRLKTLALPESLEIIGNGAFSGCNKLTELNIPKNVKQLGKHLFYDNDDLQTLTAAAENPYFKSQDNVIFTKDGKQLVCAVPNLAGEYTVPNGVEVIGESAFYHASDMRRVNLPNTVKEIGESAFYECDDLRTLTLGGQIEKIGKKAFDSCRNLKEIRVLNKNAKIGKKAFGFIWDTKNKKLVLKGYKNSTLQKYAKSNKIKFTELKTLKKSKVSGIKAKKRTGRAVTQKFKVTLKGKTLKAGRDYTVSYQNNKKRGKAKIIITGAGDYIGALTRTFRIK